MKRLTKRQVLLLHEQLLQEFGGTPGVRDEGLLTRLWRPRSRRLTGKASTLLCRPRRHSLGSGWFGNHPFVDGNKRIGTHVMLVFLALNGIELSYTQQELIDIIFAVAADRANNTDLLQWIIQHQN